MAAACSLVDKIYERYFDDDVDQCEYITSSFPTKNTRTPSLVVLNKMEIKDVGDKSKLQEYLGHVCEFDLAWNCLDWEQVGTLWEYLKALRSLNLSYNPLGVDVDLNISLLPNLRTLALNGTNPRLSTIRTLLKKCPNLSELHLSDNGNLLDDICSTPSTSDASDCDSESSNSSFTSSDHGEAFHSSVETIYLNKCCIDDFAKAMMFLGRFPNKKTVYLSENPFRRLRRRPGVFDPSDHPGLQALYLTHTNIEDWESVDLLHEFPDLKELKLNNNPLVDKLNDDDKPHLVIARLEKLQVLNGSAITKQQRETAERFFIRYYQDMKEKPAHYFRLVDKHGTVERLVNVDLSPKIHVTMQIICEEANYSREAKVNVTKTVGEFMRSLEKETGIPYSRMRLFFVESSRFPVEIRFPNQPIRMLHPEDGDSFVVQSKLVQSRKRLNSQPGQHKETS